MYFNQSRKTSNFCLDLHREILLIKSYIKDTTDFVRMIRNKAPVPDNTLLGTLDVTSLCTNILNQEGTRACAKALLDACLRHKVPGIQTLMLLLRMVLTMNNFEFNGAHTTSR